MNKIIKEDLNQIINCNLPWEKFNDCTILISGASSFIASYLVYTLMELNCKKKANIHIIAMCRNEQKAIERFGEYVENDNFELLIQDVVETVKFSEKIDYCIHAASPAGIFSRQTNPLKTFETNVIGCKNLLDYCKEFKIKRFMLISSVDVYGKLFKDSKLIETDCGYLDFLNTRNAYSNGKRASETLCSLYNVEYGIETVIARPFQVYGPGMVIGDGRLHGDFIAQIQNNKKILLKSDGKAKRSFMYILDCTIALLTILLKGESGNAYNVCDECSEATVYELATLYKDSMNDMVSIEFDYSQRNCIEVKEALPCVLGCSDKLKSLGWEPSIPLKNGILRTIKSYGGIL